MKEFLDISQILFLAIGIFIAIPMVFAILAPFILSGRISKKEREEQDKRVK